MWMIFLKGLGQYRREKRIDRLIYPRFRLTRLVSILTSESAMLFEKPIWFVENPSCSQQN
jgi:hypothetical protein